MVAVSTAALDTCFVARDFCLKSTDGSSYSLSDVRRDKAVVVMFICNHCPYVKSIIGRLVDDVGVLIREHGVGAVAIMPNDPVAYPEDSFENMVKFARDHKFTFPYVIDEDQSVAKAYGAVCTPDFFCFNSKLELCYRGRFGDSVAVSGRSELFNAVRFISETGRAPDGQKAGIGCSIKWRSLDSSS